LTHPRPPSPACAKIFTRSTNMARSSCHRHEHVSSRAEPRMERLGKPRPGREGRRLSEREVSESNPVEYFTAVPQDPSTPLRFGQDDKSEAYNAFLFAAMAAQLKCCSTRLRPALPNRSRSWESLINALTRSARSRANFSGSIASNGLSFIWSS